MEAVPHLPLTVFVPVVDHAGLRIPHMQHAESIRHGLLMLLHIQIKLPVDKLQCILFIGAPKASFFQPDCIEIRTPNHQIFRFFDDKLGINLDHTPLSCPGRDHQEINHDELTSSFPCIYSGFLVMVALPSQQISFSGSGSAALFFAQNCSAFLWFASSSA